jgi:hypothetical protein
MGFLQEIDALQRWVKGAAGLNSMRLTAAPPRVARPVILWETPRRGRDRNVTRYQFVNRVQQFGKLFADNLDQLLDYQARLQLDLEEKQGVLPVYDQEGAAGVQIGTIKAAVIEFGESESLDVPFTLTYEATYTRTKPTPPPAATKVITKKDVNL